MIKLICLLPLVLCLISCKKNPGKTTAEKIDYLVLNRFFFFAPCMTNR